MIQIGRLCAVLFAVSSVLCGCSALRQVTNQEAALVSAAPLDRSKIGDVLKPCGQQAAATPAGATSYCPAEIVDPRPKDIILAYLSQSRAKCTAFMVQLTIHQSGSDTLLDIGTTVASATATAITAPLAAVHGLTAAAAITSGSKTAIDTDFFAKASVEDFAMAIQSTYYKKADDYESQVKQATAQLDLSSGLADVEALHELCALGPARASIKATLQPPAPADNATVETDVTIGGGPATKKDILKLQGQSNSVTGLPIVTIDIAPKDTAADVAKKLGDAINAAMKAAAINVTAIVKTATVAITSRKADGITWNLTAPSSASGITATVAAPSAAAAQTPAKPGSSPLTVEEHLIGPAISAPSASGASIPFKANAGARIQ